MRHKVSTLLYMAALTATVAGAVSCSDSRTYDHYKSVPLQGWLRNDTLVFDVPRQWEGTYQLDLGIRAAQTYPYRSISMLMQRKVIKCRHRKKLETLYHDTINCEIITDKGVLAGQDGISSTEILHPVTTFHLNRNDSLHITVHHIMSRDAVPGISDIGLRMERE